ncbi:MAG: hypothetical protein K9J16_13515 [Melioribacteraceae bacterium]|nr:hypothetical protein [Melioribacteraceae bacterium]MCF8355438.1 hypothetical protein [Melioribacteraceae bacterium]MCF8395373.1 hypothetical protein [Melioribacteraceae bacterium]MCF8420466.1 hypothetical protein [Melioribacteraceae bacterium]
MSKRFIIIFLVTIAACDVLTTRDPETPETPRSNFTAATTPEILFTNLTDSYKEKVLENYVACFVDSAFLSRTYEFIPSAKASAIYPAFNDWSISSEKLFFTKMKGESIDGAPVILYFSNKENTLFGDSAIYQYDYIITFPSRDETIPTEYQGISKFKINLDSRNQWVITEWEDIEKEDFPSWSELKGRFY